MRDYKTENLGLVAALMTHSIHYTSMERDQDNPKKFYFLFPSEPSLLNVINMYYQNILQVPAQSFYHNIRSIKALILNEQRSSGTSGKSRKQGGE